jgi:hypothetical protein
MKSHFEIHLSHFVIAALALTPVSILGCGENEPVSREDGGVDRPGSDGGDAEVGADNGPSSEDGNTLAGTAEPPDSAALRFAQAKGDDANLGRDVFRLETFGNEGFWTRVIRLPQGLKTVTPARLLQLGLSFDSEMIPSTLAASFEAELKTDLTPSVAPTLNDVATTEALLEAGAVIGLPAINVSALNGKLEVDDADVYAGESIGMSCALCHSITDGSLYKPAAGTRGGTVGQRVDGSGNHDLEFGKTIALAEGSRGYYPTLALRLVQNGGKSVSRQGPGVGLISAAGTELEVDAYLNSSELYPIGMFDDGLDGNGAPLHNTHFFRTDLSAPWGSEGSFQFLEDFSNNTYVGVMEPTDITTAGGKVFMLERGGAAGTEIVANYEAILASMGVPKGGQNGYPFLARAVRKVKGVDVPTGVQLNRSAGAKIDRSPHGIRVDETKLLNMNAYMNSVKAIAGDKSDKEAIERGRLIFRTTAKCTDCHRDDQSVFVPQNIVAYNNTVEFYENEPKRPDLFPGYVGEVISPRPGLAPIKNAPGTFDDKLIIIDPSNKDQPRGSALPLLVDLARRPVFLHDDSVASLDELLDATKRALSAPHPFYVADRAERADVVAFLRSLDDEPLEK